MAAYKKGQRYEGTYSRDFGESQVTDLSRDAYNPGPTPNKYVSNADGKTSIKLNPNIVEADWVANQAWRNSQASWHKAAGFSEEVPTPHGTEHPTKSRVSSWPSRGVDTPTEDQGGPRSGFRWR
jgi:hypothetical protein